MVDVGLYSVLMSLSWSRRQCLLGEDIVKTETASYGWNIMWWEECEQTCIWVQAYAYWVWDNLLLKFLSSSMLLFPFPICGQTCCTLSPLFYCYLEIMSRVLQWMLFYSHILLESHILSVVLLRSLSLKADSLNLLPLGDWQSSLMTPCGIEETNSLMPIKI